MLGKGLAGAWIELLRGLGQSVLDLLAAEWAELKRELAASGKNLAIAAGLFGAAAAFGFWLVALLLYLAIQVAAIWWAHWVAALVVTLVVLLIVAVVVLLGLRRLKRFESPGITVSRRADDHLDWWNERLLAEERRRRPVGAESRKELV